MTSSVKSSRKMADCQAAKRIMYMRILLPAALVSCCFVRGWSWVVASTRWHRHAERSALSKAFLENDLVAIKRGHQNATVPRLCAVNPDGSVSPLCIREDDVETDLFVDPREFSDVFWHDDVTDENVVGVYGEGFYGQRPVPSLGGGPGYGAQADEIWSASEEELEKARADGVEIPVLDVGIAHGEKARGGSF